MVLMVDKLNNVCYIWYNNQKAPPAGKAGGGIGGDTYIR